MAKSVWKSKTLWINVIASVALFSQGYFGFVIPLEAQTIILAGINFILRFITKDPVAW